MLKMNETAPSGEKVNSDKKNSQGGNEEKGIEGTGAPTCVDATTVLEEEELERALQIKQAAEAANHIKNLSDFEYVHLAIAIPEQDDVDMILNRIYKLQCFRDEYRLRDDVEEGVDLCQRFFEQQKGFQLSIEYSSAQGSYLMVNDFAKFDPTTIQTPEDWKVRVASVYYMFQCCCSRITAIREGIVLLTECEGMGSHNFDQQLEERFMDELMSYYAMRNKETIWLNNTMVANLAYSTVFKPLGSRSLLKTWKHGERLVGYEGRIDSLFLSPSPEIAYDNFLKRIRQYLQERYENEKYFRLPSRSPSSSSSSSNNNAATHYDIKNGNDNVDNNSEDNPT